VLCAACWSALSQQIKDSGRPYTREAAQAKLVASEAATFCAHQAIQVRFDCVQFQLVRALPCVCLEVLSMWAE
jgi:hypothetical protein